MGAAPRVSAGLAGLPLDGDGADDVAGARIVTVVVKPERLDVFRDRIQVGPVLPVDQASDRHILRYSVHQLFNTTQPAE